jgi:desulfoferrodoxin-like iron-binding protein
MVLLQPNTVDAASEKHVPMVSRTKIAVVIQVGEVLHPMEEAHHIEFVYIEKKRTGLFYRFAVGNVPKVTLPLVALQETSPPAAEPIEHGVLVDTLLDEPLEDTVLDDAALSDMLLEDEPVWVYAYCNLHGLWMAEG